MCSKCYQNFDKKMGYFVTKTLQGGLAISNSGLATMQLSKSQISIIWGQLGLPSSMYTNRVATKPWNSLIAPLVSVTLC